VTRWALSNERPYREQVNYFFSRWANSNPAIKRASLRVGQP
jgi:hypothetical protein